MNSCSPLKALLLLGLCGGVHAGSVTVEGMDREIALNQAQGKVPPGKRPTAPVQPFRSVWILDIAAL